MTIPFFVLVIEKTGNVYTGYSPNLVGVSATGTREDVERSLLEQVRLHVDKLNERHAASGHRLELATEPISERITCLYLTGYGHRAEGKCIKSAAKDGLCWQHWKQLYGHEVDSRAHYKKCELCGESNAYKLDTWSEPCSYKASNSEWPSVLRAKRKTAKDARREQSNLEARERRIAQLPKQCLSKITQGKFKGEQCSKEATRDGLCSSHWRMSNGKG
jgi:hypothetical protein